MISSPAAASVVITSVSAAWPGSRCQRRYAAFEGRNALLKDVGRGVHDARVDVAELLQGEEPPGMVGIVKDIRGGLVNRHGAGARSGVGDLTGVHAERGKLRRIFFGHDRLLQPFRWLGLGTAGCGRQAVPQLKRPASILGPGRSTSESVALNAFAVQEPHGRIHLAYTCTWPRSQFARNSAIPLSSA